MEFCAKVRLKRGQSSELCPDGGDLAKEEEEEETRAVVVLRVEAAHPYRAPLLFF